MVNYENFECSYAVLADGFHTATLGQMDKTLKLGGVGEKKITRLSKVGSMFVVEVKFRATTQTIVMPIEHVRYMIPAETTNVVAIPSKA